MAKGIGASIDCQLQTMFSKKMLSVKEPWYGECQMRGLRPTRYIAFSFQSTSNATEKPNRVPLGGRTRVHGGGQAAVHEENCTSSTTTGCDRGAACAEKAGASQEVTSEHRSSTGIGFSDLSVACGPGERTHQSGRFPKARPNSAVVTTRHRGRGDTRLAGKACKQKSKHVIIFNFEPTTQCWFAEPKTARETNKALSTQRFRWHQQSPPSRGRCTGSSPKAIPGEIIVSVTLPSLSMRISIGAKRTKHKKKPAGSESLI
jgi:hypothetical protein